MNKIPEESNKIKEMKITEVTRETNDLQDEGLIREQVLGNLGQQVDQLDEQLERRLDRIRYQAVKGSRSKSTDSLFTQWWPKMAVAGFAASLLFAVFITVNPEPGANQDVGQELELVLTNEDFELMDEDIEFYLWLEEV